MKPGAQNSTWVSPVVGSAASQVVDCKKLELEVQPELESRDSSMAHTRSSSMLTTGPTTCPIKLFSLPFVVPEGSIPSISFPTVPLVSLFLYPEQFLILATHNSNWDRDLRRWGGWSLLRLLNVGLPSVYSNPKWDHVYSLLCELGGDTPEWGYRSMAPQL